MREAMELIDAFLRRNPTDEGGAMTSVQAMILARAGRWEEAEAAIRLAAETGRRRATSTTRRKASAAPVRCSASPTTR
jgi:protein involved in temperature-dependent protein secretion